MPGLEVECCAAERHGRALFNAVPSAIQLNFRHIGVQVEGDIARLVQLPAIRRTKAQGFFGPQRDVRPQVSVVKKVAFGWTHALPHHDLFKGVKRG